jgi:hypothetical protein
MPFRYVIHARDAGFFSNFNGVINRLANTVGQDDIGVVNWQANQVVRDGVVVRQAQFPYGAPADGNLWNRFFEPLPFVPNRSIHYQQRDIWEIDHCGMCFGTYRAWGKRACRLYSLNNQRWREKYHAVYKRYIRLRPGIMERVESFRRQYLNRSDCIGVHIRHAGHSVEQINKHVYGVPHFVAAIRQQYGQQIPVIFLATDQEEVIQEMRAEFGKAVIFQENVRRVLSKDARQLHFDRIGAVELGADILSDVLLLASCQRLFHVTSNIASAVGFMNPKIEMCYTGDFESSTKLLLSRINQICFRGRSLRRLVRWPRGSEGNLQLLATAP